MATRLLQGLGLSGLGLLLTMAVGSLAICMVATLLARAARGHSAAWRYCIWQTALGGVIGLLVTAATLPGIPLGLAQPAADDTNSLVPVRGRAQLRERPNSRAPG